MFESVPGGYGAGLSGSAQLSATLPGRNVAQGGPTKATLPGGFVVSSPGTFGSLTPTLLALVAVEVAALIAARHATRHYHGG